MITLPPEIKQWIESRVSTQTSERAHKRRLLEANFERVLGRYSTNDRRSASQAARIIEHMTGGEVAYQADYDERFDEEPRISINQ